MYIITWFDVITSLLVEQAKPNDRSNTAIAVGGGPSSWVSGNYKPHLAEGDPILVCVCDAKPDLIRSKTLQLSTSLVTNGDDICRALCRVGQLQHKILTRNREM